MSNNRPINNIFNLSTSDKFAAVAVLFGVVLCVADSEAQSNACESMEASPFAVQIIGEGGEHKYKPFGSLPMQRLGCI